MQFKKVVLLLVTSFVVSVQASISISPGVGVWTLAADALAKMCTVQSKVCDLESAIDEDFAGTFTVYDLILEKACNNQTTAESIDSTFDELIIELPETISKLCAIESILIVVGSRVEHIDSTNDGIFIELDNLNTTLCSKIEQVSDDLTLVQSAIDDVTQVEIDHTQTISSKLDHLGDQVIDLNSALDAISIDVGVSDLDSCTDVLVSLANDLVVDICNLEIDVENGFAGTFTALDAQLSKSDDLVSLVDIADPIPMVDFSGVFTSLDELDEKVCTMESLVDIVCLVNTNEILCTAGSKIDIALNKICTAESLMDPLTSIADEVISELDVIDMLAVQDVCSNIEEAISKLGLIESKIDQVNDEIDAWQVQENFSKLENIEDTLLSVCSKLDQVDVTDSKLCVVDSKVDDEEIQIVTICSLIEEINELEETIVSEVDSINLNMQSVESKLCGIEDDTLTICSSLDVLDASLQVTDSKLGVIISQVQSNSESVLTIESEVDAICSKLEFISIGSLNSKLDITESLACVIESNMDIVGSLIGEANIKAIGLEGDFAGTWTILDAIENKLCTSESVLEIADSTLGLFDFSGIFTVIDTILLKECTVDSKVDIASSLTDIFVSSQSPIDFTGVFTALDELESKVCFIDNLVQTVGAGVFSIRDALGTPIFNVDLPKTISQPGRYYFAEPLAYSPGGASTSAITIAANDVLIDGNGYDLTQQGGQAGIASTSGISTDGSLSNIIVENGAIHDLTGDGLSFTSSCSVVVVRDMHVSTVGTASGSGGDYGIGCFGCSEMLIANCSVFSGSAGAVALASTINVLIDNCLFDGHQNGVGIYANGAINTFINRCILSNNNKGLDVSVSKNGAVLSSTFKNNLKDGASLSFTPVAYVVNSISDTISVIGQESEMEEDEISLDMPISVAFSPDGILAYVSDRSDNTIRVIDVASQNIVDAISVGDASNEIAFSPCSRWAYVSNAASDSVSVIDVSRGLVTKTISVGDNPRGVAASPDGKFVYVSNRDDNDVSVIDAATQTVVNTISVGGFPQINAFSPDSTFDYVPSFNDGTVSVINVATQTVVNTITVEFRPIGCAFSPDGSFVYVVNSYQSTPNVGTVSIINASNQTVVNSVSVGDNPRQVAFSPDGAVAYVTNRDDDSVSVIDVDTQTVVNTIFVGTGPNSVAFTPDGNQGMLFEDCYFIDNSQHGLSVSGNGSGPVVKECSFLGHELAGLDIETRNGYYGMNTFIENTSNIDEILTSSANTYLGNFCFNSTSTGAPNNTNFNIEGLSNITGKFSTVSQTSSFVDRPTKWKNINMLP